MPSRWYVDPAFLELEKPKVFWKTWQPVGRLDQELGSGAGPLHHGGQGDRVFVANRLAEPGEQGVGVGHGYQSSGSRNRWMVPPQVRPTAKASSSL